MATFNRVILLGNFTRDPELRYTQGGSAVCDVGLAVNDRRKDASGELVEDVTFVDVSLFGKTAEFISEYAKKGSPVLIEGRLKLDKWEREGKQRSKLKIAADRAQLLTSPTRRAEPGEPQQQRNNPPGQYDDPDEGIPF
jgi:single-strand DNA-binding protein